MLRVESSLYILDSSLLLDMWLEDIFSPSIACLPSLLTGSLFHRAKACNFHEAQFVRIVFMDFWCPV